MTLTYSRGQYSGESISRFMSGYKEQLLSVITSCLHYQGRELTPSDLSYKELKMEQLDELTRAWNIEDIYPLSGMQEGMLFHSLLDSNSSEYFEQVSCHMSGEWDPALVAQSMNRLIARYDILRTVFLHEHYSRPLQVVLTDRKIAFSYYDVREECALTAKQEVIGRYKAADRANKFDLSNDVLLRLTLLQSGPEAYDFIWSFHHILMDGWCMGIIINDFRSIYAAERSGMPLQLGPVRPYSEYIRWLEGRNHEESVSYWKNYLSGYESPSGLPGDEKSDGYRSEPQTSQLVIPREQVMELHKISRTYGVTLNTIVQGAWGILLSRYNNTDDVLFGSVVSGRPAEIPGIEQMVGLFINTVPVRITGAEGEVVSTFLQRIQSCALESEKYHYEPLSVIQSVSAPGRDLLNHLLIFENYPLSEELGGDMTSGRISEVAMFERTNYDLSLTIVPGDSLQIQASYSGKYSRVTIERALSHLEHILLEMGTGRDMAIRDIEMLGLEEKAQLLYGYNDTAKVYPDDRSIIALFEEQAAAHPDRIAVSFREQNLTYRQLNHKLNGLVNQLRESSHISNGTRVVILIDHSFEMLLSFMAVMKCGGVFVPIDVNWPELRKKEVISAIAPEINFISSGAGYEGGWMIKFP